MGLLWVWVVIFSKTPCCELSKSNQLRRVPSCQQGIFGCFPLDVIHHPTRGASFGNPRGGANSRVGQVALLTSACEAFSTILFFPLAWVHCYNPLLPCTDYLQTPPPFLFGCLREIILKESGAESQDLLSSELLAPKSLGLAGESRDFSIVDLDTGAGP